MSAATDARSVSQKIRGHYGEQFRVALLGLAQAHLAAALDHFHKVQPSQQGRTGRFWTNQTSDAANRVFGEAFATEKAVGFFLAHGVEYGIYLELANNRQNEALRPLIEIYGNQYIMAVEEVLKP
jgi:hypothetical protein